MEYHNPKVTESNYPLLTALILVFGLIVMGVVIYIIL